jgi:hypothetical protein
MSGPVLIGFESALLANASFSESAVGRFAELDKLIAGYSSLQASEGFDRENFLRAQFRAITSLCQDLGIDE